MGWLALALFALYAALGFGWRAWLQRRRTGDTGLRGFHGRPGSLGWWAGALFLIGALLVPVGALAHALGMPPLPGVGAASLAWVGLVLALLGVVGTVWTQLAMGTSWRVGVDEAERTTLVTEGPFGLARNPIFTMMVLTVLGLTLMTPNPLSVLALVVITVAIQLQVRVVEEPYLARTHGEGYAAYLASVGRFVPGVGTVGEGMRR